MKSLFASFILLSLISCKADSNSNPLQLHDIYVATFIDNYDLEGIQNSSTQPTLEIYVADKRFSGNSGCNQIQGSLKLTSDSINFTSSPMMTTLMICEWDSLEQAYLKALEKAERYVITNQELKLYCKTELVMTLKRVD